MKINLVTNNSFKGWIKFDNIAINSDQITSIKTGESCFSPQYKKKIVSDIFTLSGGEKYRYKRAEKMDIPKTDFEQKVFKNMHTDKIEFIKAKLEELV